MKFVQKAKYYWLIKLFGWNIYISKYPLRKKKPSLNKDNWRYKFRETKMQEQNGKCKHCGCDLTPDTASLHHIKPVSLYPGLKKDIDNVVLLCHSCHAAIHTKGLLFIENVDWVKTTNILYGKISK